MKPDRQWIAGPVHAAAAVSALLLLSTLRAHAATTDYHYDALARLRRVVHDNGVITNYALDAAGNRTQVDDLPPVMPSAPASLTVPATNNFGTYPVSWATSAGSVLRYELGEFTDASFASQNSAYTSETPGVIVRNRPSGTFYYRVRACGSMGCSAYTAAANPVVVTVPDPAPPAPANATARFVATCVWRATWDAAPGAAYYRLRESVGVERNVIGVQADVICQGGQNSNRPDRVRACNSAGVCGPTASF